MGDCVGKLLDEESSIVLYVGLVFCRRVGVLEEDSLDTVFVWCWRVKIVE